MDSKYVVRLRVGEPVSLTDISRQVEIKNESDIRLLLQKQIKEHFNLFGVEPYSIQYSRQKDGYEIRANSTIGRIMCGDFVLEITSKFNEIEIGKWLQLAHHSKSSYLVRHNNEIAESSISDKDKLVGIDYFVLAFLSAVYDCVNQGLVYDKGVKDKEDPDFRGKLNIRKYIQYGANPFRLQIIQNTKNYNCNSNSVIKKALEVCVTKSSNIRLRGLANEIIDIFADIDSSNVDLKKINYEFASSLPRPEYDKALAIAKIILEGFSAVKGGVESFIPYFTINLDELFEKFVSYEINRMLRGDLYDVMIQERMLHPIEPLLADNFIIPDIVIRPKEKISGRLVVLDTKNKYSLLTKAALVKLSNQDLFQMVYYCQTVGTDIAVLVYPGDSKNCTKYPLMGSEGKAKYEEKRRLTIDAYLNDQKTVFKYKTNTLEIYIIAWRIDLSGTLKETRESVAQLSQFIADCAKREIL